MAVTAHLDNPRWDGVPIFIRTGKRMGADRKVMTIAFHEPPRLRELHDTIEPHAPTRAVLSRAGFPACRCE